MSTKPPSSTPPTSVITEVRYSLPEMLKELQVERAASSFSMEKLDQVEIGKLFKTKAARRAKSKK
jgi:hypothetical protein